MMLKTFSTSGLTPWIHLCILWHSIAPVTATVTFFDGVQQDLLSPNISSVCNDALNTALECPNTVQLMLYPELDAGELL